MFLKKIPLLILFLMVSAVSQSQNKTSSNLRANWDDIVDIKKSSMLDKIHAVTANATLAKLPDTKIEIISKFRKWF